jgi:hypothetical protein
MQDKVNLTNQVFGIPIPLKESVSKSKKKKKKKKKTSGKTVFSSVLAVEPMPHIC